ncbi:hypothetical protein MIN45_P0142 [Methylomarinovum tepidoasis]|uniref:Glycosyltransferase n=1 Tax=Methylomarinovum tepidoasis TaxID=2840183 RepID=A0AAU9CT40_9GAMM|nr:glycosyltransferase family 4 protein [Methylomarinovum sp. IN45]BCX87775.1 hypothetical protein MIN45_P0142 [Methylomarinovum sp. IN45]
MKKRLCFVGLEAYPVFNPEKGGHHGGEGVQQALLARAFVRRGYEVHMVVLDHGQPDGEVIDGIRLWKAFSPQAGISVLRFVHPRATGLLAALARADADLYYQSCAGVATALTAWHCRRHRRPFVYRVASDTDCIPGRQLIRYWRDRKLYEWGLRQADLIVAQSCQQQALLRRHYGLDSEMAGMLVEELERSTGLEARHLDVLWVNNIRPVKCPQRVLEIAAGLPDLSFRVIGGACPGSEKLYADLQRQAQTLSNLEWSGFLPYHQSRGMFARAKLLLSTSDSEGFPNTYLQAWMAGTPVVAFFDPDGIIEREGLGVVVSSVPQAVEVIRDLLSQPERWQRLSRKVRAYALAHHGPGVVDRYEALFRPLLERN